MAGGLGRILLGRGALDDLNLLAVFQLVKVLRLARGSHVHVELGAGGSVGLHRRLGIVLRQFLESVVDILRHQAALFDPAFLAAVGSHPQEAPLLLQHFDAIAVMHRPTLLYMVATRSRRLVSAAETYMYS